MPRKSKADGSLSIKASPNTSRALDLEMSPMAMREAEKVREKYRNDLPLFAKECLTVMDRDNPAGAMLVPCEFTPSQLHLHRTIEEIGALNMQLSTARKKAGLQDFVTSLPIETVCLKARKVMFSTYFRARAFWLNEFRPGHNDMVIAHEKDASRNLAEICQRFHRGWETDVPGLRSVITRVSDDLIEWEHDSRTIVKTPGGRSGGSSRGFTYNYLHVSELPSFPAASTELSAATTACATFREIHIESTAKGFDVFKDNWDRALWLGQIKELVRTGKPLPQTWNRKYKIFWAWWQDAGYATPVDDIQREYIQQTLDEDEVSGIEKYKWSWAQIQWRREKISGECSQQRDLEPKDFFKQEYPSSPEEAFIAKGRGVFDRAYCLELHDRAVHLEDVAMRKEKLDGMPHQLARIRRDKKSELGVKIVDVSSPQAAELIVWRPPVDRRSYVMGIDTAEGLPHGDDSVIWIGDRTSGIMLNEVASYIGKASGDDLGAIALYLHRLFNNAFIGLERNTHGIPVGTYLVRNRVTNIFHGRDITQFGDKEEPETFSVGFQTTPRTKPLLINGAQTIVKDREIVVRRKEITEQMLQYQLEDGVYAAPDGLKDDGVMATSFAVFGHQPDVGPPVWAGLREEKDEVEAPPLDPKAEERAYFKRRIDEVLKQARKNNARIERMKAKATRMMGRGGVFD